MEKKDAKKNPDGMMKAIANLRMLKEVGKAVAVGSSVEDSDIISLSRAS